MNGSSVRATEKTVEIFDPSYQLVKTHPRTQKPRRTDPADFPEAIRAILQEPTGLLKKAGRIGPHTRAYAEKLLEPGGHRSRRKAAKLVGLTGKHPANLLEEACRQALRLEIFGHDDLLRLINRLATRPAAEEAIPISSETSALVRREGKTPAMDAKEVRRLFAAIETDTVIGLRDRALIATMLYTFGRVSAVVNMRVKDYAPASEPKKGQLVGKAQLSVRAAILSNDRPILLRETSMAHDKRTRKG